MNYDALEPMQYSITLSEQERKDIVESLHISLNNYKTVSSFGNKDFDPVIRRLCNLLDSLERADGS
jgi:hypothetical protein